MGLSYMYVNTTLAFFQFIYYYNKLNIIKIGKKFI